MGGGRRESKIGSDSNSLTLGDFSGATPSSGKSWTMGSGSTGCESLGSGSSELTHQLAV